MNAAAVVEEQAEAPAEFVKVTCPASGRPVAGLKVVARGGTKTKSGATLKTNKYECPECGRRVGTYKARKGDNKGKAVIESHWNKKPASEVSVAEPDAE